jgi:hypothetical protein
MTEVPTDPASLPFDRTYRLDDANRHLTTICNIVHHNTGVNTTPWISIRSTKSIHSQGEAHTGASIAERGKQSQEAIETAVERGTLFEHDGKLTIPTEDRLNRILKTEQERDDSDQELVGKINEYRSST